jgi:protein-L-isoaspartate(D-aspartate) O-methyltransferase
MADYAMARETMVDRQIRPVDVTDRRIISAFGEVPRELFVPVGLRAIAYSDKDLPLKVASWGEAPRHLLAPAVLARLFQLAEVTETDIVLDVGCATGYSSAVLARLTTSVVALEADPDLSRTATETLIDLGIGNVAVVSAALDKGYPAEAPYDVIVLGGSVPSVPHALTEQLKDGGRLVAIVGLGTAGVATLFRRTGHEVSSRPAFNLSAAPLPGFAPATRSFVF